MFQWTYSYFCTSFRILFITFYTLTSFFILFITFYTLTSFFILFHTFYTLTSFFYNFYHLFYPNISFLFFYHFLYPYTLFYSFYHILYTLTSFSFILFYHFLLGQNFYSKSTNENKTKIHEIYHYYQIHEAPWKPDYFTLFSNLNFESCPSSLLSLFFILFHFKTLILEFLEVLIKNIKTVKW